MQRMKFNQPLRPFLHRCGVEDVVIVKGENDGFGLGVFQPIDQEVDERCQRGSIGQAREQLDFVERRAIRQRALQRGEQIQKKRWGSLSSASSESHAVATVCVRHHAAASEDLPNPTGATISARAWDACSNESSCAIKRGRGTNVDGIGGA